MPLRAPVSGGSSSDSGFARSTATADLS